MACPGRSSLQSSGNGTRLCVDLRNLNVAVWVDGHPLPKISELLSMVRNSSCFNVLEVFSTYHQVSRHPDSKPLSSFVTSLGAYWYCCMSLGLAPAVATFHCLMQHILKNLPKVVCFQDDILVQGEEAEEEDNQNLREVWRG